MAENIFMTPHAPLNQLGLKFSDIVDSIPSDKDYGENDMSDYVRGGTPSEANCSAVSSLLSRNDPDIEQKKKAYVQIIEQPQPKALRFRYICEGRSAGSIPGVRSTAENKTFPKIKIVNYKGPAVVVVSCVTVDPPYRPHPHNLVGKEGCSKGVCTVTIDNDSMECMFSNLGIQCVKKKDVEQALRLREEIRVDPFGTGFGHRNQPQNIDLNAVRLCFQVFLNDGKGGRFTFPLKPVVSEPIYDKKAATDLNICKLSDCTSCVSGGKEIILLCDKVAKEDIQVRFFEVKDGHIEWEGFGDFQAADVHKQVAISFKTPRYKDLQVEHSVKVFVQLQRPSDKSTSEPRPFEYLPMDAGRPFSSFKRLKNNYGLFHRILGLDSPLPVREDALPHKPPGGHPPLFEPKNAASFPTRAQSPLFSETDGPERSNHPVSKAPVQPLVPQIQSVDDIKHRMVANLEKKRQGAPPAASASTVAPPNMHPPPSPLWLEDVSVYSDADLLDEMLSQGSVNDLLSTVGDGVAVYEDVDALPPRSDLGPDALYGDASYASCYSNLEFAQGRGRATTTIPAPPLLPPKKSSQSEDFDLDFAIYGTPSGRPIHPNKEMLLRERGFLGIEESTKREEEEDAIYYPPVSDILEVEEESESLSQAKDLPAGEIPQTILDLFV